MLALSLVCARWGVDHPDIDVVQFVVRRAGKEHEIPAISIGASILQMFVSIVTLPAIAILPPSTFFQPELGPSTEVLAWSTVAALISVALVVVAWWGRLDWHAPADQQREAERFA